MIDPQQGTSLDGFPRACGRREAIALCLVAGTMVACGRTSAPAELSLAEGQPFPAPLLALLSDSAALQGKMLILNLWATWCAPCRQEMPDLERLSKTLDPARFTVQGLSVDADTLLASEFLLQNGITFANHFDPNGEISRSWGLQAYPETFVIASNRVLVKRIKGYQMWNSPEMLALLEGLYQASLRTGSEGPRADK